jgi:glycosyltransferase involved in cell wall biosynthesis
VPEWRVRATAIKIQCYLYGVVETQSIASLLHKRQLYRMRELSLIITVMNEEENIKPLLDAIRGSLIEIDYEIIFVDDGSTDKTRQQILNYADERTVLVELRKNYGQSTAMMAGIDHSKGKYIALLDGDLQNDPSDIPAMLGLLKSEDWDVVAGNRKNRKDGYVLRKIPSGVANALIRRMTGVYIKDYGCTLKIFKREIAEELNLYGELHRFIPVLAKLQGARITQVDVKHHPRKFGKSKYGINRTFRVLSDLVLIVFFRRYMQKPMHLFGTIGFICFGLGVLINLYLLVWKILGHDIWNRPLLILGLILLLGGIQFITIGILAEINIRTYYESQNKKTYTVRKVYQSKSEVKPSLEITV